MATKKKKKEKEMENFDKKSELTPVALVVEGRKLWINPQHLANHSDYFKSMFFKGFKGRDQEVIQLEGKTLDSFLPFLRCLTQPFPFKEGKAERKCAIVAVISIIRETYIPYT